ncbi:cation-translocating P-type ATPase [Streptomyces sp. NPDC048383]|uniref:P-type ATPase n=1 Tax=Streptomyces sp. NPDC048383 TaxID=3155386 RepID=UPI00343AA827
MRAVVRAHLRTPAGALCGLLCLAVMVTGPVQDAVFVVVTLAATALGVFQGVRARRTTDRLAVLAEDRPVVRRAGKPVSVGVRDLVVDDVVEVGPGDRILVDGSIVGAADLEIDEHAVPGEADPVVKQRGDAVRSGALVLAGTGAYAVTDAGARAARAGAGDGGRPGDPPPDPADSVLDRSLRRQLAQTRYLVVPAALVAVVGQWVVGRSDPGEAVRQMVSALLPMLPGGLVLFTSMARSAAVVRLGRRRCLVRGASGIEGIGRVDTVVLGADTPAVRAEREVAAVHVLDEGAPVAAVLGLLSRTGNTADPTLRAVAARFPPPGPDAAPAVAGRTCGPFPHPGWSGVSVTGGEGGDAGPRTWLLGAPDALLPGWHSLRVVADAYGAKGLDVLVLARSGAGLAALLADPDAVPDSAEPVALVAVAPRAAPETAEAGRRLAGQGVTLRTLPEALLPGALLAAAPLPGAFPSGAPPLGAPRSARPPAQPAEPDHPLPERPLPERCVTDPPAAVPSRPGRGPEFVAGLRARGHRVAVVGHGVDDLPVLRQADTAVSSGAGTAAARGTAALVLLGPALPALPAVVAEGRRLIGGVERIAVLFLTKAVYGALLTLAVVAGGIPYPFLPRQHALVASLVVLLPALFLVFVRGRGTDQLATPFAGRGLRFAVPAGALIAAATCAAYGAAGPVRGGDTGPAAAAGLLGLFLVGLWVLALLLRPFGTRGLLLAAGAGLVFLAVLLVAPLRDFFRIAPAGAAATWTAVGFAVVAGLGLEVVWAVLRHRPPDPPEPAHAQGPPGRRSGRPLRVRPARPRQGATAPTRSRTRSQAVSSRAARARDAPSVKREWARRSR